MSTRPDSSEGAFPLLVSGMHRSGTSMVAAFLVALGADLGERLLPADANNIHGYFEDLEILSFQRRVLTTLAGDVPGWPDWGFLAGGEIPRERLGEFREEALGLLAARLEANPSRVWGWKDPRTTLLLDFWQELLPNARHVLVYRAPWDVVDSIARLGAEPFLSHPDYALGAWISYNQHLLRFASAHPTRVLLLESNALPAAPGAVLDLLRTRLGVVGREAPAAEDAELSGVFSTALAARVVDPELLVQRPPAGGLFRALPREAREIYTSLERRADLSLRGLRRGRIRTARTAMPPAGLPCVSGLSEVALADGPSGFAKAGEPPQISIVVPCFNDGLYLPATLASALFAARRASARAELLIVDDGSNDPLTRDVLEVLKTCGFRVLRTQNRGLAAARNTGIAATTAPFVLPLDADNLIRPGYLEAGIRRLAASPALGVVYADASYFGRRRGRWSVGPFDPNRLVKGNYIDACAVIRRKLWEDCGGYDEEMPEIGLEDWDLWLSAAERGWSFEYVPEILWDYRVRKGSLAERAARMDRRRRIYVYVARKHHHFCGERLDVLVEYLLQGHDGQVELRLAAEARVREMEGERAAANIRAEALEAECGRLRVLSDRDRKLAGALALSEGAREAAERARAAEEVARREAEARLGATFGELRALYESRTFRYTAPARRVYASLRALAARLGRDGFLP